MRQTWPMLSRRVVDCFLFCHELDLLEIRLRTLENVVDRFVLCEGTKTHTGQPKPLFYADNAERFKRWSDQIEHVVVEDYPAIRQEKWTLEHHQRRALTRGLPALQSADVVMLSDLDEIPAPEIVKAYDPAVGIVGLAMVHFMFYLNTQLISQQEVNTRIFPYSVYANTRDFQAIRHYEAERWGHAWPNSGWHFSYCGGTDNLLYKVRSYFHAEEIKKETYDRKVIESVLRNPTAERPILPGRRIVARPIDRTFPDYVRQNQPLLRSKSLIWPS